MTKDLLESELKTIRSSFRFINMLEYNQDLLKGPKIKEAMEREVLIVYHAFSTACDTAILDNPLTIGGYVRRAMETPEAISAIVSEARKVWGAR